jgi:hypothetical protein
MPRPHAQFTNQILGSLMFGECTLHDLGSPEPPVRAIGHEREALGRRNDMRAREFLGNPPAFEASGQLRVHDVSAIPKEKQKTRTWKGRHNQISRLRSVGLLDGNKPSRQPHSRRPPDRVNVEASP